MKSLFAAFLCIAVLAVFAVPFTAAINAEFETLFDEGNAMFYLLSNRPPRRNTNSFQVAQQIHLVTKNTNAWYEAVCLYRENAICMHFDSSTPRRPQSERTLRNMNIAVVQSYYRFVYLATDGRVDQDILDTMIAFGMDPNDTNTALDNPVGIANVAASLVYDALLNDEMNANGSYENSMSPGVPYADYTDYTPVNGPKRLIFPNRWQPAVDYDPRTFKHSVQTFMTPQMAQLKTFGNGASNIYRKPYTARYRFPRHHHKNTEFFNLVEEVIEYQQNLTEQQKMVAEAWDDKVFGPPRLLAHISGPGIPLLPFVDYNFLGNLAGLDSFVSSWAAKAQYDRVRPVSVIRHFFKDRTMMGLAEPGEGLKEIKGSEWRSYAYTDAHPEYPSGTTCFCYAIIGAIREKHGSDVLNSPFQFTFEAGSSFREPDVTPSQTITSKAYTTLSDIAYECGESRIWAGVHFRDAVEETYEPCTEIGERAYQRYYNLVNGISKD